MNKLILGDALDELKKIESKSINLIVIDPPYNIGKDKRWDKWKTVSDYVEWFGSVLKELERVLKDNGSFYFFHNDFMQIVEIQNYINKHTEFIFKQLITWNKIDPSFKNYGYVQQRLAIDMMRNYYNGFTEYCLFYTFQDETGLEKIKHNTANFEPLRNYFKKLQEEIKENKKTIIEKIGQKADHCFRHSSSQWDLPTKETYQELINVFKIDTFSFYKTYKELRAEYEELREQYEELRYTFNTARVKEDLRANSNVWLYPPAKNIGHITPKPVELIENIIKHSSNENDIVLDCFGGSGTTAIACIESNRKYIAIEKDEEYFKIAKTRIEGITNKKDEL